MTNTVQVTQSLSGTRRTVYNSDARHTVQSGECKEKHGTYTVIGKTTEEELTAVAWCGWYKIGANHNEFVETMHNALLKALAVLDTTLDTSKPVEIVFMWGA